MFVCMVSIIRSSNGIVIHHVGCLSCSEWYSWHFPELVKIVNDNYSYAKLVKFIKDKSSITDASLEDLTEVIGDEDKAREVIEAAKASMGMNSSVLLNTVTFRVI